jgi:hypothetical protein
VWGIDVEKAWTDCHAVIRLRGRSRLTRRPAAGYGPPSPEGPRTKLTAEMTSRPTPRERSRRVFDSVPTTMIAPVLAVAGVALLGAAILCLRSIGPGYRVARLLAAAPDVSLGEAIELARRRERRYVRVRGRITSDEEFPDENERPLVFRRSRLEARADGGRWRLLAEERLAVPFGIELRAAAIDVDVDALGDGLVVIPRESEGAAADLPRDQRTELDAETPVRLRLEQVSAVEQAVVAGVPALDDAGAPRMTAGMGRPLVLTTLEPSAAMRLLAAGRRGRVILAASLLVGGLGSLAGAVIALVVGA